MSKALRDPGLVWRAVLERFEQQAPASVMARMALEHALPAGWVDEVFETNRQQQYARELLFSTVVELMTLVVLGLRPSLHAAARKMDGLPVSLTALYDKVNRTEPAVLRALVRGSAERLGPVMAAVGHGGSSLPGWQLRVLDGNHLGASEKRLGPLRGHRGAALPGQSLVVYDPDAGLVVDLVAWEDAHASERVGAAVLLDGAGPGQVWVADRHFCTRTLLGGWDGAGACFVVREHANHPRLAARGEWCPQGRTGTGAVREQAIMVEGHETSWRCVELALDQPTQDGDTTIRLWSNLPTAIDAAEIAGLYRKRWHVERSRSPGIEGMFGRLEAVLHSEIPSLGHPRAALLGFAVSVLAHNVLALLGRCVELAHQPPSGEPPFAVSLFHLALHVTNAYGGLIVAIPPQAWPNWHEADPESLAKQLLALARHIKPHAVATSKRRPKPKTTKGYVDGKTARAHVATARVLAGTKAAP